MTLLEITSPLQGEELGAWERFEAKFDYPLDRETRFRISHDGDPSLFFRAIGIGQTLAFKEGSEFVGSVGWARRRVLCPDGSEVQAMYVGDLKIAPDSRNGLILWNLFRELAVRQGPDEPVFGIVMQGTAMTPDCYTGRLGFPHCRCLASVGLLRVETEGAAEISEESTRNFDLYATSIRGGYGLPVSDCGMRSNQEPLWLDDDQATGVLEDTHRAKRLHTLNGAEILTAHLSQFSYLNNDAGLALIHRARAAARNRSFDHLYVTIRENDVDWYVDQLQDCLQTSTMMDIYGDGFNENSLWNANSSEV